MPQMSTSKCSIRISNFIIEQELNQIIFQIKGNRVNNKRIKLKQY